jgi:ChrB-like protein
MAADSLAQGWLLFLVQLPSKPSSARVALWRRLRAIGATTMVNGAWVLPDTAAHAALFGKMRERVLRQGGTAFVLSIPASPPELAAAIVRHFRADRAREYDEFAERCAAFLDEIGKEAGAGKYTFAEMEEGEQDLEKLARWLKKIQARDFFPDERRQQSFAMMARCRDALDGFSHAVYVAEGVQEDARGDDSRPARRRLPPPTQRVGGPPHTQEGTRGATESPA